MMVRYILLRDNKESGPFTLAELKAKTLYTTDLVWIEGESTCWSFPSEIPALKEIPLDVKKTPPQQPKRPSTPEMVPSQTAYTGNAPTYGQDFPIDPLTEEVFPPSFEALKEKYAQSPPRKRVWQRQINIGANLIGMATLFIGLGLSAYMIKKAVENIEYEPVVASANAIEIRPENLPGSTTSHAAYARALPQVKKQLVALDTAAVVQVSHPVHVNPDAASVSHRISEIQKTTAQVSHKPADTSKESDTAGISTGEASGTGQNNTAGLMPQNVNEAAPEMENKPAEEKEETAESKPTLRLSANKYNVGILGGISHLELSVSNPSAREVSKAVVEVEYLRPNGKVVGSQTVTVSGIAPGGSQTVPVPDHNRGTSVRYKVIKVER